MELLEARLWQLQCGGTASKITGGKFANGARTAAFQFLFNALGGKRSSSQKSC